MRHPSSETSIFLKGYQVPISLRTSRFLFQQFSHLCIFIHFAQVLVGAFLVKSGRLSQWPVFFRQTADLIVYVPLFTTDFNRFTGNPRVRAPALARNFFEHLRKRTRLKGPLLNFFGIVRLFSEFFFAFKESPFDFFNIFQQTGFSKSPKVLNF